MGTFIKWRHVHWDDWKDSHRYPRTWEWVWEFIMYELTDEGLEANRLQKQRNYAKTRDEQILELEAHRGPGWETFQGTTRDDWERKRIIDNNSYKGCEMVRAEVGPGQVHSGQRGGVRVGINSNPCLCEQGAVLVGKHCPDCGRKHHLTGPELGVV